DEKYFVVSTNSGNSSTWIIVLISLIAAAAFIVFLLFVRRHKWILSKVNGKREGNQFTNGSKTVYPISLKAGKFDGSTSQTTSSSSRSNTKKEETVVASNDRLTAQDLSSVIGLMAYGSLKNDINKNLTRKYDNRGSRKYAGHSANNFDVPSSSSSSSSSTTYTDHIKNTREISQIAVKNHANDMNSSFSKKNEISEFYPLLKAEENRSKIERITKLYNFRDSFTLQKGRKNDTVAEMDKLTDDNDESIPDVSLLNTMISTRSDTSSERTVTNMTRYSFDNDESIPDVSLLNTMISTRSDTSSERTVTNMTRNEITSSDDESLKSRTSKNLSLSRRLTYTWVRSGTMPSDDKRMKSCDNTQQISIRQPNSTSRILPECQVDFISRTFPVHYRSPLSPSTQTINSSSTENAEQNKCPSANSIHSSDFEIPPYLNTIPTSSYSSQQFTYGTPKIWARSHPIDNIRRRSPSEELSLETTNSTQTHTSSTRIHSDLTRSFKTHVSKGRIHSEWTRSPWTPSTYQLENKECSQQTSTGKLTSELLCQTEERGQISHHSGKCESILSTIPLTNQTSIIFEGYSRSSTDFESSLSHKFVENQQSIDFSTKFEQQSIESYPRSDLQFSHPELSEITSISSDFSGVSNCLNLGKDLKVSDVEELLTEQSSLVEGLKMKMNIVLMPKQHQPLDKDIGIEEHQSDRETNSFGSISPHNSTATTTYESTQDLSTIKS
uniref:SH2 domain-containing protein n=1 Tax=Elaeophora elaphi TaxID=1147741 RepID=A0A0R3RJ59_9BILA